MIAKGQPFYAVVREETSTGLLEVLSCGQSASHAAGRLDDFRATSSGKRRTVSLVKLAVEEVLEEIVEGPVREA